MVLGRLDDRLCQRMLGAGFQAGRQLQHGIFFPSLRCDYGGYGGFALRDGAGLVQHHDSKLSRLLQGIAIA